MAGWVQQGNIRGPQGPQGTPGAAGRGVQSSTINGAGELVITYTDQTTANLGVVKGAAGDTFKFQGEVPTYADLPVLGNTAADRGKAYLVTGGAEPAAGNLFAWSGTAWTDAGQIRGPQGPAGPQGIQGDQGPQGIQGVKGDKGDVGAQGAQGIQGVKGDKGDTGAAGAQGIQGVQGVKGDTGAQGVKGDTGATGARGSQWFTGVGAPANITGALPGDKYLDTATGNVYDLT